MTVPGSTGDNEPDDEYEDDWTAEENQSYRRWMFTGPDGDAGEAWEIQERAWIGGYRAGVSRLATRDEIAKAIWDGAESTSEREPVAWAHLLEQAETGQGDYAEIRDCIYAEAEAVLVLLKEGNTNA